MNNALVLILATCPPLSDCIVTKSKESNRDMLRSHDLFMPDEQMGEL